MNKINDDFGFFKSIQKYYEAKKDNAIATIKLYVQEPAGVGEHSEIQVEIEKWVSELSTADEALSVLKKHFTVSE